MEDDKEPTALSCPRRSLRPGCRGAARGNQSAVWEKAPGVPRVLSGSGMPQQNITTTLVCHQRAAVAATCRLAPPLSDGDAGQVTILMTTVTLISALITGQNTVTRISSP